MLMVMTSKRSQRLRVLDEREAEDPHDVFKSYEALLLANDP